MKYPCILTKKISELTPAKYNPRKISDEAIGRLTKSLAEFGNIQPITWNSRTGNLVGGHQRLKVFQAMGKTEVEVWAVDLDEKKEKAANIALNKLAGEFDLPALKDILEDLDTGEMDLEITGFGMEEISKLMEQFHVDGAELPDLADGDKLPFQQKTFVLHDEQAEEVDKAVAKAKEMGHGESSVNENSNGNGLAFVCQFFNRNQK
jgi:ParB-like chromosome segregation protein Spo0J